MLCCAVADVRMIVDGAVYYVLVSCLAIINCTTPTVNDVHAHCPRPDHHFWAEIN